MRQRLRERRATERWNRPTADELSLGRQHVKAGHKGVSNGNEPLQGCCSPYSSTSESKVGGDKGLFQGGRGQGMQETWC